MAIWYSQFLFAGELRSNMLFLAALESGAPLSSSLEEALYKCSV